VGSEPKELTAEQKFAAAEADAESVISSYGFMSRCPHYHPCKYNADVLQSFLRHQGLPWSTENFIHAYEVCEDVLRNSDWKPPLEPTPEPEPTPIHKPSDLDLYGEWVGLTKRDVRKMPADLMLANLKDPKFRAKVEALHAPQGEKQ
jgi:hypothetical protein